MPTTPSESVETPYGWLVAVTSMVVMATAFGSTYLVVVGLKPIAAEFGWPRQIPSLAFSAALFGAGLGGIVMGLWSDRRGMLGPAVLGALAIPAGAVLSGISESAVAMLFAHGVVLGFLGNGTMFAPLMTNATRWFDRRRGIAVAVVSGGQSLAGAAWPPLFRWAIDTYGWRETMIGFAAIAFCIMFPLAFVFRRNPPVVLAAPAGEAGPAAAGEPARVLGLPANLVLGLLSLAIVACCLAMAMPMVHVVAHCSDLGFLAARGAEMLSVLLAGAIGSRLLFGWIADRIGGLKTILISSAAQAVMLSCFVWVDTLLGLYVISAMFGLAFGGIVPSYALAVRELFALNQVGWRIGVVYFFGTLGMALGGYFGGLIFDLTASYQMAFLAGVGANIVNLAVILFLVWRQGGPAPELRAAPA